MSYAMWLTSSWYFLLRCFSVCFGCVWNDLFPQLKAFLRGESLPFTSAQLEGIAANVNEKVKAARKLCNSSLRYWILEYLRKQPKERRYRALVLKFLKDRIAALLLVEVSSKWLLLYNYNSYYIRRSKNIYNSYAFYLRFKTHYMTVFK